MMTRNIIKVGRVNQDDVQNVQPLFLRVVIITIEKKSFPLVRRFSLLSLYRFSHVGYTPKCIIRADVLSAIYTSVRWVIK